MSVKTFIVYHSETKIDVNNHPIVFGDNCKQPILSNVIASQSTIKGNLKYMNGTSLWQFLKVLNVTNSL